MVIVIGAMTATITAIITAVNVEEKKLKEEVKKKSIYRTSQGI